METPIPNKIARYIDANTGELLFSEPFYDPDGIYGGFPYKVGDKYKSHDDYLTEQKC